MRAFTFISRKRVQIMAISTLLSTGCAQIQNMWHSSMTGFNPTSGDYADDSDDEVEGWITEAGSEGRADMPREFENDPLKNILASPKARSIERNLGYD